jgi:hypothetical protein
MTDDLAELQEQNDLLRTALDFLLNAVEQRAEPDGHTLTHLAAAGYEYKPAAPEWRYKVSLSYDDTIMSEDEAYSEEQAIERIRDRFTSDVIELVLRGSYEDFMAAVEIVVKEIA